ncbi:zinc-ribbon domain-containing protein [Bifidobacterium sp. 82T24]|uniref:zinc ribbon domain-containing protein n=1 Tax=Bifidobacterium pluvialisilvae TaxID=2834436 RepID=UPI001C579C41|nr:zinc ribbon domain-containing protein [Bifidobacterium pluvialisilvae]MBW3088057.1 zinc-ribbon domain-containing protein [Bifidobacterium pluvialisilvae]
MIYCSNCGEQLPDDADFCTQCGTPTNGPADIGSEDTIIRDGGQQQVLPSIQMPVQPVPAPSPMQASSSQQPTQSIPTVPTNAAQPAGGQTAAAALPPNGGRGGGFKAWFSDKRNLPIIVIGAALIVALMVCGGVVYAYSGGPRSEASSSASQSSSAPTKTETTTASPAPTETKTVTTSPSSTPTVTQQAPAKTGLNSSKLDAIVNKYSSSAVSVVPSSGDSYNSAQANSRFVASGLYLPVYLAAHNGGGSSAISYADAMMRGMNNSYGNSAISAMGGRSALNSWLSSAGYSSTDFERAFGDVTSSSYGAENYTSPSDAARMLIAVDQTGGTGLMTYSLASEGVYAPSGATIYGHRGRGIKNAYNYFITMKTSSGATVGIAVMTQSQGQGVAAQLANEIMAEVNSEL